MNCNYLALSTYLSLSMQSSPHSSVYKARKSASDFPIEAHFFFLFSFFPSQSIMSFFYPFIVYFPVHEIFFFHSSHESRQLLF